MAEGGQGRSGGEVTGKEDSFGPKVEKKLEEGFRKGWRAVENGGF